MEAAAATSPRLTRSASLSSSNRLRRSRTARFPPSPHLCPLSSSAAAAAASPRALLPLRRTRSDADLASVARSAVLLRHHAPVPAIFEADDEEGCDDSKTTAGLDRLLDVAGAGAGGDGNVLGGGGRGGSGGQGSGCDMGEYYRRVLLLDPENPLLLRNYGKYLHEVEGDLAGAEGCYARALLACPGDADLLSLYGRVIWEASQEKERAEAYFERAVQAAPDDCYVLGSYASFLWDAEEDDDHEAAPAATTEISTVVGASCDSTALVPAF